jgi:class 3 adenylate cyclase
MGLRDALASEVKGIFNYGWKNVIDGRVVPDPSDLRLGDDGRKLDGSVLYADLVGSSELVDGHRWWFAAEVYKAFLTCAARIIKMRGGVITAYDGDRIMSVFLGETKNTDAVQAALNINYAMVEIIRPALKSKYPKTYYVPEHCVGIDTGELHVARVGVKNDNDLVWVGSAANQAAKLSDIRKDGVDTWISKRVFDVMMDKSKYQDSSGRRGLMWKSYTWNGQTIYGSTWHWGF